ncbi:anti-sigma factor antagonist [Acrocarpospora phusangensis]|uniref:Anti-sigma factor antagonist n=1 Tax=Acrocarpospora phusangensis TaxID=1070424 RepID=A0A919UNN5_9ACTN|nr:STAS domain-containing protein [Acrocarpospora phusangensis]GIH22850.1 anti-sigma factor antagonist [Acrocarpospora phusangensis]
MTLMLASRCTDSATVISAAGELDATNTAELTLYIAAEHPDAARPLVLDLATLTFIDSSGLRILMDAHQRSRRHGSSLHLAAPHERVIRLLELTGLDQLLSTHPTLEQALAAARHTPRMPMTALNLPT